MITSDRTKWYALALLCAVQFMVVLDIAIVNAALPSIQVDLGFPAENLQGISAYARLRRVPAAWRPPRGHPRATARVHGRARHLLGRLAPLRARLERRVADRRPRPPGPRGATITPSALSIRRRPSGRAASGTSPSAPGSGRRVQAAAGVLMGGILTDLLSWSGSFVNARQARRPRARAGPARREPDAHAEPRRSGRRVVTSPQPARPGHHPGSAVGLGLGAHDRRLRRRRSSPPRLRGWEQRQRDPLVPFSIFRLQTLTAANIAGFTWARRCSRCSSC
jgi:hypothetical protein